MAVTESTVIKDVKRMVYSALPYLRPYQEKTLASLTDIQTTIAVNDIDQWQEGDIVSFADDTFEECLVTGVSGSNIVVTRGANGTTAVAHSASVPFDKNARFRDTEIRNAIQQTLYDLWPQVWVLGTGSAVFAASTYWYPISDAQCREVLTVFREEPDYLYPEPLTFFRYFHELPSAEFTQKQGIHLPSGSVLDPGNTFYYVYRKQILLVSEIYDRQRYLVSLGATYLLLGAEDAARSYDPGRQTDRTVQPGQNARDSLWFLREFIAERRREEIRLYDDESRLPKSAIAERARRYRV